MILPQSKKDIGDNFENSGAVFCILSIKESLFITILFIGGHIFPGQLAGFRLADWCNLIFNKIKNAGF